MPDSTQELRKYLTLGQAEIGKAIRGNISAELLIRATLTYAQKNPKIFECSRESVAKCLMDCASLGLLPDGTLGTAYLVPYGSQCTLIIGYRGMIELARRSDKLTQIEARVVREGDVFKLRFLSGEPPIHEPKIGDAMTRPVIGAYAVAHFHNDEKQIEFMDLSEIEAIRMRSRAGNNGPWKTDYAEMAKKTVVRRLMKYLPLSPEMSEVFDAADREMVQDADVVHEAPKPQSKSSRIASTLASPPAAAPIQEELDAARDRRESAEHVNTSTGEITDGNGHAPAQAPAASATATAEPEEVQPDVITANTKIFWGFVAGKRREAVWRDMSDEQRQSALDSARASLADPNLNKADRARNMGVVNFIEAKLAEAANKG